MKFNMKQLICFGLLNYVFTFPNDLFDELWQINESAPQASDNPIESQPKIKVEPDKDQFYGRCLNESALKGPIKVKHEQHYEAVKVEGTVKIEHEFEQNDGSQKVEEKPNLIKVEPVEVVVGDEPRLKMISPLSKSARRIRAKNKMPQNDLFEEDNCSEEPEEANIHSSNETFGESDYSESEDFNQQNSRKRICRAEEEKLEIINKSLEMKQNLYKNKRSYNEIDKEIAERFSVSVRTIHKWKKESGISLRNPKKERKHLVEKFDQMKAELKRKGFKNSFKNEINETIAKQLGITDRTIYAWKRELGHTKPNKYAHSEQKKLMKRYYKIKDQNPKISDLDIVKMLKIGKNTLYKWKKQFTRQQFHSNSVDGHSVEENAAANVQEIEDSNSES